MEKRRAACPDARRCFVDSLDGRALLPENRFLSALLTMPSEPTPNTSPFMLFFRNAGPDTHAHLTPAQKSAMAQQWNDWVERLATQGKLPHAHPLGLGGRVVSGPTGQRATDGPYAEAKEVVGGYFLLTVADLDEATAIAQQCPGLPLGLTVEVRPVATFSPVLTAVNARPVSP